MPRRGRLGPTTQASAFAAGRSRAGYSDRLLAERTLMLDLETIRTRTDEVRRNTSDRNMKADIDEVRGRCW